MPGYVSPSKDNACLRVNKQTNKKDMIDKLPPENKKYSLPIVPNTDFIPARQGGGPSPTSYSEIAPRWERPSEGHSLERGDLMINIPFFGQVNQIKGGPILTGKMTLSLS
jgi:hypothetical protein